MSRPLRIEYENAWYHVMNRGANRKPIFKTNEHRMMFLSLLEEVTRLYYIEIHGYCLMGNHYHLLIKTPHANLGRAMRHLNGVYTMRYNRLEKRDGCLFRGRYKAILIEENVYLLQVSRYIHLNPVTANFCKLPHEYLWSSYGAYTNKNNLFPWVQTSVVLNQIGGIEKYIEFMMQGVDEATIKFYGKKYTSPVLGTENFKNKKIDIIPRDKLIESNSDIRRTIDFPSLDRIIKVVSNYFQVAPESLIKSTQRQKNLPRQFAIYISKHAGLYTYKNISDYFELNANGARSAVRRFDALMKKNSETNRVFAILMGNLN